VPDDRKRPAANADLAAVDRLCRMQLEAHRLGCRIILVDGDEQLRDLMAFVGIADLFDPLPSADVGQPTNDVASSTGRAEYAAARHSDRHDERAALEPDHVDPPVRDTPCDGFPRATVQPWPEPP
jgi:hypothetical protein